MPEIATRGTFATRDSSGIAANIEVGRLITDLDWLVLSARMLSHDSFSIATLNRAAPELIESRAARLTEGIVKLDPTVASPRLIARWRL